MIKTFEELETLSAEWGKKRNLNDLKTQVIKLSEEHGEFCGEIVKDRVELAKKELGDVLVVQCQLARLLNTTLTECLSVAYEKVSNRKGRTINDSFVKKEDLK